MNWLLALRRMDWWIIAAIIVLQLVSNLIMYGIDADSFVKQVGFTVLSAVIIVGVSMVDHRFMYQYSYVWYGLGLLLLIAVLLFGTTIRGTTGWFNFGFASFQPVELAKITLLIALARFCSDHSYEFNRWRTLGIATIFLTVYIGLVMLQPDFGSTAMFTVAVAGMILLTNIRWRQIAIIIGGVVLVGVLAWFFYFDAYQHNRILTFLDPSREPLKSGYNVTQSIISVGSGGITGRGLGLGTQSQLRFLPERETDFIFAVIAEELGFMGALVVIIGISIIIFRLWAISRRAKQLYVIYFCIGLASLLFFQSIVNIGMNIGIMPVTGVPLPFVSAGGSSLLALSIAIGIVQSAYRET